jgi:hypothetical protein
MAVRFSADGEHYTRAVTGISIWSACFWYYSVSATGGPFAYGGTNAGGSTVFLTGGSTLKLFDLGSNGGGFGSMPITNGVWYRIAIMVNGTNCTWYHGTDSGALTSASVTNLTSPTAGSQQWSIGYDSFDADTIDGRMANLKIWTGVARTEAEFVTELATTAAVNTTGLVQRHPFDVAEATDYSGNNNTLSGGVGTTTEDSPAFAPPEVTGAGSAPLGDLTSAATGIRAVFGSGVISLGGLTSTVSGVRSVFGAASTGLNGLTGTADGVVAPVSNAALGGLTASATGEHTVTGVTMTQLGALAATAVIRGAPTGWPPIVSGPIIEPLFRVTVGT